MTPICIMPLALALEASHICMCNSISSWDHHYCLDKHYPCQIGGHLHCWQCCVWWTCCCGRRRALVLPFFGIMWWCKSEKHLMCFGYVFWVEFEIRSVIDS